MASNQDWDDAPVEESSYRGTQIVGYDVFFPRGKRPFPPQLAVMSKALLALRRKSSALLESPTGTGKTLALLCSTLAWQRPFRVAATEYQGSLKKYKQGIQLEYETDSFEKSEATVVVAPLKPRRPGKVPQIFFASRTHSQLAQAVAELKRCPEEYLDGLKMTILAGRKHSCTNPMAQRSNNIDEDCRKLHSEKTGGACALEGRAFVTRGALPATWDLEDLVRLGKQTKGCGYYASRGDQQAKAHVVFTPYNYIVDPAVRRAMNIDLKGAVVVFDEAHNIEGVARDAASADLSLSQLDAAVAELRDVAVTLRRASGTRPPPISPSLGADMSLGVGSGVEGTRYGAWSDDDDEVGFPEDDFEGGVSTSNAEKSKIDGNAANQDKDDDQQALASAAFAAETLAATVAAVVSWARAEGASSSTAGNGPSSVPSFSAFEEENNVFSGEDAIACLNAAALATPGAVALIGAMVSEEKSSTSTSSCGNGTLPPSTLGFQDGAMTLSGLLAQVLAASEGSFDVLAYCHASGRIGGAPGCDSGDDCDEGSIGDRATRKPTRSPYSRRVSDAGLGGGMGSVAQLSGPCRLALSALTRVLGFMVEEGLVNLPHYRVVVRRERAGSGGQGNAGFRAGAAEFETKVCFWCLSGSVAFRSLRQEAHALLLTSGTLSPLDSFASELGMNLPIKLEAGHVVNLANQVCVFLICFGINDLT